ncbi:NTP transferase domain-containing protein [Polynucleobacter sp. AP-Nino-20-G2]|uniref:nucleotidyltransferase family protein n=1 Tax=Polynucleobacter sp. AP-Nino-20-G2 TaxID=2576917 RepID=UPI001BFD4E33|nr:nucleotidyltransferase family protein [Polynucleobacter sp. AP-Nino-20-G2]QWE17552.1 nucleotidyltransferase family protein [Polynucleobacter sp. AP-Nino-20-G2]
MTTLSSITQQPLRLAILLLAAGEGSRLGSYPKGLLMREGKTLIERFAKATQSFKPVEFVAVTGFHVEAIKAEVARVNLELSHKIQLIHNPHADRGQASSVRLGLETLHGQFDVLLIALSDQPEVGAAEIAQLLDQFSVRQEGKEIILPIANGQRGNPILFSRQAIQNILALPNMVCRPYMDAHEDQVHFMETENTAFVLDVDTPQDIQTFQLSKN